MDTTQELATGRLKYINSRTQSLVDDIIPVVSPENVESASDVLARIEGDMRELEQKLLAHDVAARPTVPQATKAQAAPAPTPIKRGRGRPRKVRPEELANVH